MTQRVDRTLPHHPAIGLVIYTQTRRHTTLDDRSPDQVQAEPPPHGRPACTHTSGAETSTSRMSTPPTLGTDVMGWARTAHYITAIANGDVQLRSEAGIPTRYFIRRRGPDRLELTQSDDGDDEQPLLFVADIEVLERHLIGLFADDIGEDLDLPFLDLHYGAADLARGYEVSDLVRGYRLLTRSGGGPIAAAPDPSLSLLSLCRSPTSSDGRSLTSSDRSSAPLESH